MRNIYGAGEATQEYHCHFGFNPQCRALLDEGALRVTGVDERSPPRKCGRRSAACEAAWGDGPARADGRFRHAGTLRRHRRRFAEVGNNIFQRWLTQREVVVIQKPVRKESIVENFNVFDFELSAEDMDAVAAPDTKQSLFFDHRDPKMVKLLGEVKLNA